MSSRISDKQWQRYEADGYLRLGKILNYEDLAALQKRIDQIMLGEAELDYDTIMMQLDSADGQYESAGPQTRGFKGPTRNYRKIQDLENDPLFLAFMQRPLFREICRRVYGEETPIAGFRAMFMNKPARQGTLLPWHQDRWSNLDRDPLVTLWTALDPATIANGCVQIVRGSHHRLINPDHPSGFVTPEQGIENAPPEKVEFLELAAGEAVLLHNWLLHRSDTNTTDISRRAFSVCYMDARTTSSHGDTFPLIFGEGSLVPAGSH